MLSRAKNWISSCVSKGALGSRELQRRSDTALRLHFDKIRQECKNPILRAGRKYFSQNDEDGIIRNICDRLHLRASSFVELGPGCGLENNSLALLAQGWRGGWIGGEELAFELPRTQGRLHFERAWITTANCGDLVRSCLAELDLDQPDLLSIDLDGNDIYIADRLLQDGLEPQVLVVEYNGKFPPPAQFRIPYRPDHQWDGTDYFGASLQTFCDMAARFGYRLVCCNITGINAFFVRSERGDCFEDVPTELSDLFIPARYSGILACGHPVSPRTVVTMIEGSDEQASP